MLTILNEFLEKNSYFQLSGGLPVAPMYAIPPPPSMLQPPIMSYPLIPAPLGPVPSPIIRPHPSELVSKVNVGSLQK